MSEELKYKVGDEVLAKVKILDTDRYPYLLSTAGWFREEDLDEITVEIPQKPIIPRFMADIIVSLKENDMTLYDALNIYSLDDDINEIDDWVQENSDTFARAWLDGYEVEEKKKYFVKLKNTRQVLFKTKDGFEFRNYHPDYTDVEDMFTRETLEQYGFKDVFDNPMFEVEEVE